jgi:hypothetical protein
MVQAVLNRTLEFDGSEDVIVNVPPSNRDGVQIIATGFNIEDAVITTISDDGVEEEIPPPEDRTGVKNVRVARHFSITGIKLNGLTPAGDYAVRFKA